MIKILIAEDNQQKANAVKQRVIEEGAGKSVCYVDIVTDVIQTKSKLKEQQYDLLILDVVLPTQFGDEPSAANGISLLKYIRIKNDRINAPFHIIGLSAYDEAIGQSLSEFNEDLWALIKYDEATDQWSRKLSNKISYLVNSKRSLNHNNKYDYDVGVICALDDPELQSVLSLKDGWTETKLDIDSTTYYENVLQFNGRELKFVAAAAPLMGMQATSVLTCKMIEIFTPRMMIMTGIAAGIKGEVECGDVIVADCTWDYGSGKIKFDNGERIFEPDPRHVNLDVDMRQNLIDMSKDEALLAGIRKNWQGAKPRADLNVHISPLASGAAVIASQQIWDDIVAQQRKLKGIDMETYGFMYACQNSIKPRPSAVSIKSVSDNGDSNKSDEYRYYASYTSAAVMYEYISRYYK